MRKKKISIIVSNIGKSLAFEWTGKYLNSHRFDCLFILINCDHSPLEEFLYEHKIPCYNFKYAGKTALPKVILSFVRLLRITKPDIIHCHLFEASLIGLLAGKLAGVKRRIYTRHHSTYNHSYNRKGVYLDKFINWLATDIVAISNNVRNVLLTKEQVSPRKVQLIYHGFDLEAFANPDEQTVQKLAQKYNLSRKAPVIGVIARWIAWKGIQYVIPAFKSLLVEYPDALLVLANAKGPFAKEIMNLLEDLPAGSYCTIDFEKDLFALYRLFDVYVHVPVDPEIEAFGQTYVEALAAGIPSVFTLSGVAKEFVVHEKNALVASFKNSAAIKDGILKFLKDQTLSTELIENGKKDVKCFELAHMIKNLDNLYKNA